MDETVRDEDEMLLRFPESAKPIEVVPEMLDYDFIAESESADELRAVLRVLKSGEYGKYPDLEMTARAKLVDLLPDNERRNVLATATSKPSAVDADDAQTERLRDWLSDVGASRMSGSSSPSATIFSASTANEARKKPVDPAPPVRATIRLSIGSDNVASGGVDTPPRGKLEQVEVFRKENLSTKEYFDRWDKFDVDAALESDDETESESECSRKVDRSKERRTEIIDSARARREREMSQLRERSTGLALAERRFLSAREREKGDEFSRVGENEEAISCYSKSILLDESDAESYASRAAAFIRRADGDDLDRAVGDCTRAIEIDPTFVKARARRGMCHHRAGWYEDAVVDFKACHEAEGGAGYDELMRRSEEKLHEAGGETDGSSSGVGNRLEDRVREDYDCIEEIYTPGALKADQQQKKRHEKGQKSSPSLSTLSKAHFTERSTGRENNGKSGSEADEATRTRTDVCESWHKISIIETSDSDEDTERSATASMRRIDIVEETDSEGEESQGASASPTARREDSNKLKAEGNDAMKHRRYGDAVKFYSLALDVDPDNTAALNNRSIAHIKLENWEKSIADASSCLEAEPNNTKALYRRGYGMMMQSAAETNIKEALDDFRLALSFGPPKDQLAALFNKADECEKILASMKESRKLSAKKTDEKKKVRHHDTRALAF